jgi:hypothetical protein
LIVLLPFLPDTLELDGTYERLLGLLYTRYCEDILDHGLRYKNRPVVADDRLVDSEYEEGFWHVVLAARTNASSIIGVRRE